MLAEPTIAMCENIVRSFAFMFPSVKVGKAYGSETNLPKDSRFVVCTNGYLRKRLLGFVTNGTCASVEMTDIIMLDEVHMGLLDTHVIVSTWWYCSTKFASTARMPRLLLSSATVGETLFARTFSPCVSLPEEKFKPPFPISVQWAPKDYGVQDTQRYAAMGAIIKALHESRPISERILAFVPGTQEQISVLQAMGMKEGVDFDLVLINSKSREEDSAPLDRAVDARRLITLATPSGDAGLTIVNLFHVVDSLMAKVTHTQSNGSHSLDTEFASKQLMKQRMGRVGRKAPGIYYPMCTEEFYNSGRLAAGYTLEIHRVPLYQMVVELVRTGIPVEETFAIYDIPTLPTTISQLLQWGLIRRSPSSGVLFPSSGGSFMTIINIDNPRLAGVLYAWVRLGHPVREGVILMHLIASFTSQMLRIPNFEPRPGDGRGKLEQMRTNFIRKHYGRFLGPSDVHTAVRLWNTLQTEVGRQGATGATERWCVANGIQFSVVKNMLKNIDKTLPRVEREAQRFAVSDAAAAGDDPDAVVVERTKATDSWAINEGLVLPILRRLMEHIYQDEIATRAEGPRPVYVSRDGTTMEPKKNSAFTLQADPDTATSWPLRIVVIGKMTSQMTGKLQLTQFLDVDDHNTIATISTEEMNKKLGIFTNRSAVIAPIRRISARRK